LFKEASLFTEIKEKKRIGELLFFTADFMNVLNKLKNRAAHIPYDFGCYSEKDVAPFMKSGVRCMLQELGLAPKEKMRQPRSLTQREHASFRINGEDVRISKRDVLEATKDPAIFQFFWISRYVEIEGSKYPPKGLISLASGIPARRFTTDTAQRILERLGFKVRSTTEG